MDMNALTFCSGIFYYERRRAIGLPRFPRPGIDPTASLKLLED